MLSIFCATDYFLPGYKAGGPIKTISNAIDRLKGRCDFSVLTSDGDIDGEKFTGIKRNLWLNLDGYKVYYANNAFYIYELLRSVAFSKKYDLIYLNSFFSWRSILIVLISKIGLINSIPVLLAPRGELSNGALGIKPFRKKIYIFTVKTLGIYKNISFQASSFIEENDIKLTLKDKYKKIYIARDIVSRAKEIENNFKYKNGYKIIFLSRIVPVKNIDFVIKALKLIRCDISLDIFGPIEDVNYWQLCNELVSQLPHNIIVKYKGAVYPENVISLIAHYDLFVLPSKGESFGHVVYESLCAGTPVLVSDKTPWVSCNSCAIESLPIDEPLIWANKISSYTEETEAERRKKRTEALALATKKFSNSDELDENFQMFLHVKNARY